MRSQPLLRNDKTYNDAIHQLNKLNSFPAIALSCLAPWLENSIYNRGVASSSPIIGTVRIVYSCSGYIRHYTLNGFLLCFDDVFVCSRSRLSTSNEACGNRWTWNKMDAKFGFCINYYARIQNFRVLRTYQTLFMAI